ncbi:hypothetical protein BO94DRAFT_56785 [Aspergillus sclerotioniger CBS 115572]|uniref:Uncharacterized protein n=1 Tax=Aspergillus sclerotioniger CBS 115572 TaxID=1450535 RepID=A0A317WN54_9EURO|nr:hypothetical protein BO94DRAFT_56785 [Aspergillus sclerotioniger CBS 115572]PWY87859.1 hypothetical protein BO94DRAFT_56785 [Aspergillus sclerotioniger CBS 115572]
MIRGQTGNTSTGIQSGPVSRTRRRPSPRRSRADPSTCKILIFHCFLHLFFSSSFFLSSSSSASTSTSTSTSTSSFLHPPGPPAPWPSAPPRDLSSFLVSSRALTVLSALRQRDPCNVTPPNILVWPLETGACASTSLLDPQSGISPPCNTPAGLSQPAIETFCSRRRPFHGLSR